MTDLQDHMKVGAPRYTAKQDERPRVSVPLCPSPRYVQQLVPCSVVWVLPPLLSITTYRGTQYDEFFLFSFLLSLLPMTKNREGSNVEWSKEARDRSRSKVRKVQSCPGPSLVDPSPLLFGGPIQTPAVSLYNPSTRTEREERSKRILRCAYEVPRNST